MSPVLVYISVIICALVLSFFNVTTISVLLATPSLRSKPSTYPLISLLIGCLVQAMSAAPAFVYKEMVRGTGASSIPHWLCSFRRYSYFLSHHSVKWSLLLVSIERLASVKWPYRHHEHFTTKRTVVAVILLWITTVIIDSIPFYHGQVFGDRCSYSPDTVWSFSVIIVFNILPFIWMVVNYFIIWRLAVNFSITDQERMKIKKSSEMSLSSSSFPEDNDSTCFLKSESNNGDDKESFECNTISEESDMCVSEKSSSSPFIFPTEQYRTRSDTHSSTQKPRSPIKQFKAKSKSITESIKLSLRLKSSKLFLLNLKATKTCFLLVVVYMCCWGPLGIFYTIDQFCDKCLSRGGSHRYTRVGIKALCFSSSVFVPVVYCWFSSMYKRAAKRLYQRLKMRW